MKSKKSRGALSISKRFFIILVTLLTTISPAFTILNPPVVSAASAFANFPISFGSGPGPITTGPDGALWFAQGVPSNVNSTERIVRLTTTGNFTQFQIPLYADYSEYGANVAGITTGPDGAIWFTDRNTDQIERFTTEGQFSSYVVPSSYNNLDDQDVGNITTGPDGALWFTMPESSKIGRITTSGVITEFSTPTTNAQPVGIVAGPDGALWFTESNAIGRVTTTGNVTEYTLTSSPGAGFITTGPDGALWFTQNSSNEIGRITTTGNVTEYTVPTPNADPLQITEGPDGALWFVQQTPAGLLGKITTGGDITEYSIPTQQYSYNLHYLTTGPDGNLWLTERYDNQIVSFNQALLLPSAPTNLTLTTPSPTNQSPALSWTAASGATSYNVYRNGGSTPIGSSTTTSFTDTTAPQGTDTYDVTAVNSAGESPASNTVSVLYDTVAPTITYTVTQANGQPVNGAGWYNSTVTVTFQCADPTAGVVITSCTPPAPVTLSSSGANQTVTGTATDSAGNTATATATVNLDTDAPTITATVTQANGQPVNSAGWYTSPVSVTYTCTDATSPVTSCGPNQSEATDGQYTLSGTATDAAGNTTSSTTTVNLDQTPPSVSNVSLGSSPLAMGATTTLSANVSDNLSGVNKVEYFVGTDPGAGNGTPMSYNSSTGTASAAFGPFTAPGTYTVSVRSQDVAGNWSSPVSQTFTVYPAAANLTIVPGTETNTVGGTASFTATATDTSNNPVAGITVRYSVSGSITTAGSCVTGSTGQCTFSYTGPQLPGADLVDAYADNNNNGTQDQGEPSTNASVGWVLPTTSMTSGDVQVNGKFVASNGDKMHVVAHAKNLNGTVTGTCNLIDTTTNTAYTCTDATVMVENLTTLQATIFGDITINGQATTYRIDVADNSATNQPDTFNFVTQSGYSVGGNLDSNARVTVK